MHIVRAQALTPEAFRPFGDVVSAGLGAGVSANLGTAVRFNRAANFTSDRPAATPNLCVFRSTPKELPFALSMLEKHPHSTQLFAPMKVARYLVCVAPTLPDGSPDHRNLQAFVCLPGQGINYRAGVWHHPILALDEPADFLMLAWEDGSAGDCVEHPLPEPVRIET